ncbi:DNA translocase FtsK [Candidatus Saganbacteria bacterium]|nr:DNA translocase FtsK [Candidatus Saganbacteria bacterium]
MARKKNNEPSPFAQDLTGILLVALAVFILVSNFSSGTGLVGLYVIKLAFRSILGIGIYLLPFILAAYGVILLFRHEVKELATRLTGLLILFFTFITAVQFYAPNYFETNAQYNIVQGAGGFLGYIFKFALERSIGAMGAYIVISAFALISLLLVFNITFLDIFSRLKLWLSLAPNKKAQISKKPAIPVKTMDERSIPAQIPLIIESFPMNEPEPPKDETEIVIEEKKPGLPAGREKQSYNKYKLPPLSLLDDPTAKEKQKQDKLKETTEYRRKLLEDTLKNFGVGARVVSTNQGPAVTRYELQPDPGVKISRIASLSDDIALNLAAQGVRIEAPVPGKSVIGIEVPNVSVTPVRLKEIVKTNEFINNQSKLFIALGKDLSGTPIYGDLAKMPHLLIAGTTGSGKSVCINSLIISLLLRARPDELKFIMIDPKMVELSVYDDIPHLLAPVVTDAMRAALTLKEWVMKEMERRYKLFYDVAARNIFAYNSKKPDEKIPHIVVVIDELADLMMLAASEVETTICRLAQMARATGIHLVIATQRPSVDVITGLIKANIPSRIAFAVATQIDSRVILDASGAEKLLGRGDMLYNPVGAMKPIRLQGSYVTDKETEKIIDFIKEQAAPEYLEELVSLKVAEGDTVFKDKEENGRDALFIEAVKLIIEAQVASTSYLQRKMRIGYNRAARLMDDIEAAGVVSKPEGEQKTRRIVATMDTLVSLGVK